MYAIDFFESKLFKSKKKPKRFIEHLQNQCYLSEMKEKKK